MIRARLRRMFVARPTQQAPPAGLRLAARHYAESARTAAILDYCFAGAAHVRVPPDSCGIAVPEPRRGILPGGDALPIRA